MPEPEGALIGPPLGIEPAEGSMPIPPPIGMSPARMVDEKAPEPTGLPPARGSTHSSAATMRGRRCDAI